MEVNQGHLVQALRIIFPDTKTIVNARRQTLLRYPVSGAYLELDIFLPRLRLAFEFQDAHHYVTTWYAHKPKERIRRKDYIKRLVLHQKKICLIDVPCWWDGTPESLIGTINFYRPDLELTPTVPSIALNAPSGYFSTPDIPGIGELMLASFPTDAKSFSITNNTWWLGEKYDGIRCCWSPVEACAYTRSGKELLLLPSVEDSLPSIFMDGEFWFGRGQYAKTYYLFKGSVEFTEWSLMRMVAFDNPASSTQSLPFEERYESLLLSIPFNHSTSIIAMRVQCKNDRQLKGIAEAIIEDSGEGVILRKVASQYEHGRTPSLVKLKTTFSDKEGIVVSKGVDSVKLKLPDGQMIEVPQDSVYVSPLSVGDVVSFSFECQARRDVPINPKIYRIRTDLSWEDVVFNAYKEKAYFNDPSRVADFMTKPVGHWTTQTMRAVLENFAKEHNMDPLVPDTWHHLPLSSLKQYKGGQALLQKFKGYFNAVRSLFPDVSFDHSLFAPTSWYDVRNRRKFFEDYAKERGFDPLNPTNWYSESRERIRMSKGGYGVISYYRYSVSQALMDLFPNIGLEKERFLAKSAWHEPENRRKFFEDYADTNNFDPLNPDNWYKQSVEKLTSTKGAFSVIHHHGYSVSKALISLFPEISFDRKKFMSKSWSSKDAAMWSDAKDRRKFFEQYAQQNKFDPLVADNWYMQPKERILAHSGTFRVIQHHNRSLTQALCDLFSEIGLVESKFSNHRTSWHKRENRRKFFEEYAAENSFDPLVADNWYSHPVQQILAVKGLANVVYYHQSGLVRALVDLFPEVKWDKTKLQEWRTKNSPSSWNDTEKRRKFFEEYTNDLNLDPLIPQTWYSLQKENIMAKKGASAVIGYHKNNLSQALLDLFPDIGLNASLLWPPAANWSTKENRKEFFVAYAEANGFDPFVADNWYSESRDRILSVKGATRVMYYHSNNIAQALCDLFPDIGLDNSKLLVNYAGVWRDIKNRKQFFKNYAKDNKFDALVPSHWYLQSRDKIRNTNGAFGVLSYYEGSVIKALLSLFPNINLEKSKFRIQSEWSEIEKQRKSFERFAFENNFDPLISQNWYSLSRDKLKTIEGITKILRYHNNSMPQVLIDLFPEINLDKTKLLLRSSSWNERERRRKFFEEYAKENSFDPLVAENWYIQSTAKILGTKGARRVLMHHKLKVSEALLDLFPDINFEKSKLRVLSSGTTIFR